MSYLLPHLHTGWHVDQAILSEEDRVVILRFGRDGDETCMRQDEILSNVAEKIEHINLGCPIQIVHHQRRVIAVKINKLANLALNLIGPAGNHIWSIEFTLISLKAWIANHTCGATNQCYWSMPGLLKAL